jgi:mono/diheme cytochrome c family protein
LRASNENMRKKHNSNLWGIALIGSILAWVACSGEQTKLDESTTVDSAQLERGLTLFEQECARCHGSHGLGNGIQAVFLYPKPRDFASGHFRITSTQYGFPTDDDLMRSISNGLPGSAMPPFGHLAEQDREALVVAVKHLAVEGKVQSLLDDARAHGDEMTRAEALELTNDLFRPGPPVHLPEPIPESAGSLERGRELYGRTCASCHAPETSGGKRDMQDDTGAFVYPRVLESALFARGRSRSEIALTISRGLPGTPMPAFALDAEDLWALADYVASLGRRSEESLPAGVRAITLTGVTDPGVWTEETVEIGYEPPASVQRANVVLRAGEEVVLVLKSADVTHSFYSPELGVGPIEVYPGHPQTVRLIAPAPGEYPFYCDKMCGHCHFSMKGTITVVAAGGDVSADATDAFCRDIPTILTEATAVERGKALYDKMACGECHGSEGRGGVENFNAIPTQRVPALEDFAESLLPWGTGTAEVNAVIDVLETGTDPHAAVRRESLARPDAFLRLYDRYLRTMREGRYTPPRDPTKLDPPLQMPAWNARLTEAEMNDVLAYLLSLYDGPATPPVRQVIAFNHSLHVNDADLTCVECHTRAAESPSAGLPAITVCQDCHFPDDLEFGDPSEDLKRLISYVEADEDPPWKRVHQLPDHARFTHRAHVTNGGLECETCHGDMSALTAPPERPAVKLRMDWCLDCHEQRQAPRDCNVCHR